jgi:hypothetical protein
MKRKREGFRGIHELLSNCLTWGPELPAWISHPWTHMYKGFNPGLNTYKIIPCCWTVTHLKIYRDKSSLCYKKKNQAHMQRTQQYPLTTDTTCLNLSRVLSNIHDSSRCGNFTSYWINTPTPPPVMNNMIYDLIIHSQQIKQELIALWINKQKVLHCPYDAVGTSLTCLHSSSVHSLFWLLSNI